MTLYDKEDGMQSILNAALGAYHAIGFRLVDSGDYTLSLYYRDELVGVLANKESTIPVVHEACRRYLESMDAL
jgi:hypothetical protein